MMLSSKRRFGISDNDVARVSFDTDGKWTARDVVTLVSAVSEIYDARLAAEIRGQLEMEYVESLRRLFRRSPSMEMLFEDLYHEWKTGSGSLHRHLLTFPLAPLPVQLPEPSAIFSTLHHYVDRGEALQIDRIRIESPGSVSFAGIADIVGQLREFLKDILFRNRQERQMGEIKLLERFLRLQAEYSDSQFYISDSKLHEIIGKSVVGLRSLRDDRKLTSVGDGGGPPSTTGTRRTAT